MHFFFRRTLTTKRIKTVCVTGNGKRLIVPPQRIHDGSSLLLLLLLNFGYKKDSSLIKPIHSKYINL